MIFFTLIWLFALGAAFGSFLNVVVYRTIKGESPAEGRSYCDHCGAAIGWKQNIPVVSFLLLGGKCVNCRKKISWEYPVIEFLTGMLFVWWYVIGKSFFLLGESPWVLIQPVFWFGVAFALWLLVVFDLKYSIIPDFLSGGLLAWVFFYRLALFASGIMRQEDFVLGLIAGIGLMLFFYGLYELTGKKGFGLGDVKLAPSLGLLLGWPGILVGAMASFVFGSVIGVFLMFLGKKRFGQTVPFGPFLAAGTAFTLLWGDRVWMWYVSFLR